MTEFGSNASGEGKLWLVGTGPGDPAHMTARAEQAICASEVIIGYGNYLEHISHLTSGKRLMTFPMGKERERAIEAVRLSIEGQQVALVSGGDAGIYGMASHVFEFLAEEGADALSEFELEAVPGVTAATAAAALIGSPLSQDFAVVSLSDRFVPWAQIERRLDAVLGADMVLVIYEPSSRHRPGHIEKARDVILRHRAPATPVAVVREASRPDQSVIFTTAAEMLEVSFDMRTTVIVGNSTTSVAAGFMITPRSYLAAE